MLIKNTYALCLGQLYSFFVSGAKKEHRLSIIPVALRSFVRTKKGSKEGTSTFAQISSPFKAMVLYFAGFIAMQAIIINKSAPKTSDVLGNFDLLCLTIDFIIM
ncbi:MAG: hypothetical protein IJ318_01580 [Clostridia bacterium]|nr:hypothetical protein [Clostridia bacterium]